MRTFRVYHRDVGYVKVKELIYNSTTTMLRPEINWEICQACFPCQARDVCKTRAIVKFDPEEPAFIELAKHFEHSMSDPDKAAEWVHKAVALVNSQSLPAYLRKMRLEELTHRLERLEKKRIKAQTTAYNHISNSPQDDSQPAKNESSV